MSAALLCPGVKHHVNFCNSLNKLPGAYLQKSIIRWGLIRGVRGLISKFSTFLKGRHKNDIIFSMK